MINILREVRKKVVIGFVSGSNLAKMSEQLAFDGKPGASRPTVQLEYRI